MELYTLNQVEDYVFNNDFDDIFVIEYKSFLVDDESEYDVFEFDDLCSANDRLLASASTFEAASKSTFPPASLKLKPLLDSLKYITKT